MFTVNWMGFTSSEPSQIQKTDIKYNDMTVRVVPDWNKSVFIEWTPLSDMVDVKYMVYSSDSEMGPFRNLTNIPTTGTSILTYAQDNDSKVHEQHFTVEVIYPDGTITRSYPQDPSKILNTWHALRQKDIIRRERILLEKFVGVETILRNPKHHGKRCSRCWDDVNQKVMEDHCPVCYGTSFEGGYDTGIRTLLQYTSIDPKSDHTYYGTEEPIAISAWTTPIPLIHPHTLVLRMPDRRLFRCEGHQGSTEMRTTMQRQNVVLVELSRDSIENELFNRTDVIDLMPRKAHHHNHRDIPWTDIIS